MLAPPGAPRGTPPYERPSGPFLFLSHTVPRIGGILGDLPFCGRRIYFPPPFFSPDFPSRFLTAFGAPFPPKAPLCFGEPGPPWGDAFSGFLQPFSPKKEGPFFSHLGPLYVLLRQRHPPGAEGEGPLAVGPEPAHAQKRGWRYSNAKSNFRTGVDRFTAPENEILARMNKKPLQYSLGGAQRRFCACRYIR